MIRGEEAVPTRAFAILTSVVACSVAVAHLHARACARLCDVYVRKALDEAYPRIVKGVRAEVEQALEDAFDDASWPSESPSRSSSWSDRPPFPHCSPSDPSLTPSSLYSVAAAFHAWKRASDTGRPK